MADYRLGMKKRWELLTDAQRTIIARLWDEGDYDVSTTRGMKRGTLNKLEQLGLIETLRVSGSQNVARLTEHGKGLAYFAHHDWWMADKATGHYDRAYLEALRHFFFLYRRVVATGKLDTYSDVMNKFQVNFMPDFCELCDVDVGWHDGAEEPFTFMQIPGTARRYDLPQDIMAALNDFAGVIRDRDSWIKYLAQNE